MEAVANGLDLADDGPLDRERLVALINDQCQECTGEATVRLVEEELTQRRRADARAQATGWRSWAQAPRKNGGRQAHRFARRWAEDSADLMRDSGAGPRCQSTDTTPSTCCWRSGCRRGAGEWTERPTPPVEAAGTSNFPR